MTAIVKVLHQGLKISEAYGALIILHGRGGTAEGMLELAGKLCGPNFYVAAPQAAGGIWYPNRFMDEEAMNEPNLSASIQEIEDLIVQTEKYIPKERIVIAGFSQGACLSLEITSRRAAKYGGVIAFTGGLIGKKLDEKKYQGNFEGTQVWISNGDQDPYIPLARSEQSKVLMEKLGADVFLQVYPGRPHLIIEEEIRQAKLKIIEEI